MDAANVTSTQTAPGLADYIAENPSTHFGKFEQISRGAVWGALTTGASANYWQTIIFGYNVPFIYIATYRNGTYFWNYIKYRKSGGF